MKTAIVLSGGGAKGAYQIGFWKAIRKLKIKYDIVTGTSIGAINGAFMVQNTYHNVFKLWSTMNYKKIYNLDINSSYYTKEGRKKIILGYTKHILKGGIKTPGLESMIYDIINTDKFFKSNIDYGLVTVKYPSLKPLYVKKSDIKKELLCDYILASSACFPAFSPKKINDEYYIDGGYYDNMPINLAIELGAERVIAVDLRAIGINRKIKDESVEIITIKSNNKIGDVLVMEKDQIKHDIKIGYNDTMKVFGKLEGDLYTFKKNTLHRNYIRYHNRFDELFNKYFVSNRLFKHILYKDKIDLNKVLEFTALYFGVDDTKIYSAPVINYEIKNKYKSCTYKNYFDIRKLLKSRNLNKKNTKLYKKIICYIYNEVLKEDKSKLSYSIANMFPECFLSAIYLKTIMK